MHGHRFLPLLEAIAGNAEFARNLGSWRVTGIQQLDRLAFKF